MIYLSYMLNELFKKDNLVLVGGAVVAVSAVMYLTGSFFGFATKKERDFLPNQRSFKHSLLNDNRTRPVHTENLVRYIVTHSYEPRAVAPRMRDIRQLIRTHTSELASLAAQLVNGTITREEYLAKIKLIAQQVAAELKVNIQPKHKPKVSNSST